MARMPRLLAVPLLAAMIAGCGHGDTSQDKIAQAIDAGRRQSEQQAAADPARQPHPNDPNPLRRALGDLQIRELFFGPMQTQGDWIAYLPCSQQAAGMAVAPANRLYLKRCPTLQQTLLTRAHSAGFTDATAANVMDARISGAAKSEPEP
ncbi:MAG: hypothetical protein JWR16_2007 [Nevskia sp.]|nr:hypothetical protein [Nevskia sp.]